MFAALAGLLACSQQPPAQQPAAAKSDVPDGWNDAAAAAYNAIDAGNAATAVTTFEKYVASHPDFYQAHEGLAEAHTAIATAATTPENERSRHLETAATHYRRAFDLQIAANPKQPPRVGELLGVFDPDRLNRPAEQESIARELVKRYPADLITRLQLLDSLLKGGKIGELDGALRAGREAVQEPESFTAQAAGVMSLRVLNDSMSKPEARALSPADARAILTTAIDALDDALKTAPQSAELLQQKSSVLGVLARVEQDPRRAGEIRRNAADLQKKAEALKGGSANPRD